MNSVIKAVGSVVVAVAASLAVSKPFYTHGVWWVIVVTYAVVVNILPQKSGE